MSRTHGTLVLALTVAALAACGGDSATGPSLTYPALSSQVLAAYCVQGNRTFGQGISGTLANTDCDLGDGTFYEVYRVRVATTGSYQFSASSTFDNVMAVLRLESTTVPGGPQDLLSFVDSSAVTVIAGNDDRSGTDTNALIPTVSLVADTDYFLVMNGFAPSDLGPYTVTFTKN
jgi:hypothetical protein